MPRKPTTPKRAPTVPKAQIIQFPCPSGTAKRLAAATVTPISRETIRKLGAAKARRWFIGTDQSSHHYLVPCERLSDWDAYVSLPESDESSWTVPDFAIPFDGPINALEFCLPTVDGKDATLPAGRGGAA